MEPWSSRLQSSGSPDAGFQGTRDKGHFLYLSLSEPVMDKVPVGYELSSASL